MTCILNTVLVLIIIIIVSCVNSKSITTNETSITTSLSPLLSSNKFKNSSNIHHGKINAIIPRNSEARENKWSYYYIAQTEWHFPLWFLLYFVLYLVFNTVRSIYNHKIDPDDYLRKRRSIEMDINDLALYALSNIQNFENKFVDES